MSTASNATLESMDVAVAAFRIWAERGALPQAAGVLEALGILTSLLAAAITLPAPPSFDPIAPDTSEIVDDAQWSTIRRATTALPFQYYSSVYETHIMPPEVTVVGDISDDIADIYRDVVRGQFLLRQGHRHAAHRHFYESFYVHWGDHLTDAIRALFMWLPDPQLKALWASQR